MTSKYLVGADGGGSITRKSLFPNSKIETLISIQEWYKSNASLPIYSCIYDKL